MTMNSLKPIIRRFPWIKRSLWRIWYEYLSRQDADPSWTFMNFGFTEIGQHNGSLNLLPHDERDRPHIHLYHHASRNVDLAGLDVLEVGCGRGGGLSFIVRYLNPHIAVGVDIAEETIRLCDRFHRFGRLAFICADAEQLPFGNNCFDAVISIESSHAYPSNERFLSEVCRVLRPGGHLALADVRHKSEFQTLRYQIETSGLRLVTEEDITPNVVRSMELDSDRKEALIERKVPKLLRSPFRRFAGTKTSSIYRRLLTHEAVYVCILSQKPNAEERVSAVLGGGERPGHAGPR